MLTQNQKEIAKMIGKSYKNNCTGETCEVKAIDFRLHYPDNPNILFKKDGGCIEKDTLARFDAVWDELPPPPPVQYSATPSKIPQSFSEMLVDVMSTREMHEAMGLDASMVPSKPKQLCECGAHKIGVKDYTKGHSDWCRAYKGEE